MSFTASEITGLVLAGGQSVRLGSADKALLTLRGRPLIEYVLAALRPQVETLLINANRNPARYAAYGHPVLSDLRPDFPGPLAGLETGLAAAKTPWLLYAPCDATALPTDLAERLWQTQAVAGSEAVAVKNADGLLPVCCLVRTDLLADLRRFLDSGRRSTGEWLRSRKLATVDYSHWPVENWSVNTPAELAALERREAA